MMKNPRYANAENSSVILDLDDDGSCQVFAEATGDYAELYARAVSGDFGDVAHYSGPSEDELLREAEAVARSLRNRYLTESDWTQVADAPVDQSAWAAYRQALRDVPSQEGFPASIAWPIRPI